ncbi:unnamed protein product [Kluyveromyces dobzhanskii CBS 2104]|uniref:WGS project CCBQ000000000 data, contig MAT n=1 Tax=Kluyveromyces dobzhanskii CBS 2104 TaxID=1427455 RepID=A0A0A8L3B1_9SACH|nr:unnamed protein product [Kluyveromyces dobzhanskii CBS 2104]
MNRISILSLLNPLSSTDNRHNESNLSADLKIFESKKTELIRGFQEDFYLMLGNGDIDSKKIKCNVKRSRARLIRILKCKRLSFSDKVSLTRTSLKASQSLLTLLSEKGKINQLEIGMMKNNADEMNRSFSLNSVNFKILTQNSLSSHSAECVKNKRFPKAQVELLKDWYEVNKKNPYITENDINNIRSNTSLSKMQIKNWLANRRRKDKLTKISEEIINILN